MLTVVDVDARTAERLEYPQLRPGDPPYRIVRRGDKLVFYGGDTYVVGLDLSSQPEKLGESWFFIPSSKPDRVWLTTLEPESPVTVRALGGVREVTVDGRVTVPEVAPPDGRWPLGAVGDALIFESRSGGLEVWDPLTERVIQRLPGAIVGATAGNLLASCDAAEDALRITDVGTGETRVVAPPAGFASFLCRSGAFSPDSALFAVAVTTGGDFETARILALVDVERGVATAVKGSSVDPPYIDIAWTSSGQSLFIGGGERFKRQIVEYRLGAERAVPLIEVGDFYGMATN